MRRAVLGSLLGLAAASGVGMVGMACGIDVLGTMPVGPDGAVSMPTVDASLPPGPALDGDVPDDGTEASTLPTTDDGGTFEVPIADASVDAPGDCGSPVIADLFNDPSPSSSIWKTYGSATRAMSFGNGYVSLTPQNSMSKVGAIFTKPTVNANSFVATFRYNAEVNPYADQIGDGFTFMWVTQGDIDAPGATQVSGAGLGVAKTVGGGAFALDAFQNGNIGDTQAPDFAILKVNPPSTPGAYDWHVKSTVAYNGLFNTWRTVKVTLDNGKLSANVDGAQLFTAQQVATPSRILAIGFTAATGGVTGIGFDVDTVNIALTDAVCP